VSACPFGAIEMRDGKAFITESCTMCGACVDVCEFKAIERAEEAAVSVADVSAFKGIWVFAEQHKGDIASVALELLGEGRKLADKKKTQLSAVLIGHGIKDTAQELIAHGADIVYVADDPALKDFNDDSYAAIMTVLAKQHKPEVILAGATAIGRSFFPKVASSLYTGLTADCTALDIEVDTGASGLRLMASVLAPALAADAAEPVAARRDCAPLEVHNDVVPMGEGRENLVVALWIRGAEIAERQVREHDPPAERVVGSVALDDRDLVARIRPLHEQCQVQACRPSTDADDAHLAVGR
jgi:hypothetical protein